MEANKTEAIDKEKEKINKLYESFEKERNLCKSRMTELVNKAQSINLISEGQVTMLSFRHELIDKSMDIKKMRQKKQITYNSLYTSLYDNYKRNGYKNLKLNRDEIIEYLRDELKYVNEQLEVMDLFILYYQKLIESLDKLGFVFKNKIDLEKM